MDELKINCFWTHGWTNLILHSKFLCNNILMVFVQIKIKLQHVLSMNLRVSWALGKYFSKRGKGNFLTGVFWFLPNQRLMKML